MNVRTASPNTVGGAYRRLTWTRAMGNRDDDQGVAAWWTSIQHRTGTPIRELLDGFEGDRRSSRFPYSWLPGRAHLVKPARSAVADLAEENDRLSLAKGIATVRAILTAGWNSAARAHGPLPDTDSHTRDRPGASSAAYPRLRSTIANC